MRHALFLTALFACHCTLLSSAYAGTTIEQVLRANIDNEKYSARHTWSLEGKNFRLDVTSKTNKTSYIFNGRVFYICSALDQRQLAFLSKSQLVTPNIIARFKTGACQIVPSNFMARFFLSPTDAVESIDRTDAMRLSLALDNYSVKAEPSTKSLLPCKSQARTFKLTKTGEQKNVTYTSLATEVLCNAPDLDWRSGLWREVSKTVLRQPGGAKFMESLRLDNTNIKGLALTATTEFTREDMSGGKSIGRHELVTEKVKSTTFAKNHFAIPSGFEIFSPEAIATDLSTNSALKAVASKKPNTKKEEESINLPSVLLCAISGSFICLK